MKKNTLSFVYETNMDIEKKYRVISGFLKMFSDFYSEGDNILKVEHLGVKVILNRNVPGFEDFVKPRKPSYRKTMVIKNPLSGEIVYDGYYTYDFKISDEAYDELLECSDERAKEIMGKEFIDSCNNLSLLKKKVPEADVEGFVRKAKSFFEIV